MLSKDLSREIKFSANFFMDKWALYYPIRKLYPVELKTTGIKYVDGWTHGMMAWTGSVIIFTIAFLLFIGVFYLSHKERSQ